VTKQLKTVSYSVCDQTKPYVYCDKTTEVSDTSVVRRLFVRRLLRVYSDKTTEVSNTSIVRRLSVRRLLRECCDKTAEDGFIFSLRSN